MTPPCYSRSQRVPQLGSHLLEELHQCHPRMHLTIVEVLHEPKHFYGFQLVNILKYLTKSISDCSRTFMKFITRFSSSS
jgi:hypothetical protein